MRKCIHICTYKSGTIDVFVHINNKSYTYHLSSEFGYRVFLTHLHKGRDGQAIRTLNKFNRKELHQ
jgi:hypothetical protein